MISEAPFETEDWLAAQEDVPTYRYLTFTLSVEEVLSPSICLVCVCLCVLLLLLLLLIA
jgi:hypothetical protein